MPVLRISVIYPINKYLFLLKIKSMMNLFADVTFDFDDQNLLEKEVFIDILTNENWINLDSENNWRIGFNKPLVTEEKIKIIKHDIYIASQISKIKAIDYAIILKDAIYIDKL